MIKIDSYEFLCYDKKYQNQRKYFIKKKNKQDNKISPHVTKNKTRYIRYNSEDKIDHIHQYDS